MRRIIFLLALLLSCVPAHAQSNPYCPTATFGTYGVVPTPGQWMLCLNSFQQMGSIISSVEVGSTPIIGGTSGSIEFNNGGTLGEATFGSFINSWLNSLPTTLPSTSGVWWNNGGTLSKS